MLGALIIVFREVMEAGLIVGVILAATRNVPGRGRWIAAGLSAGVIGAGVVAAFAATISDVFAGAGQELMNACIMSLAVAMLTWHNAWMSRHARTMVSDLKQVGQAVTQGTRSLAALAIVVGLAVMREGSEVVLFMYGLVAGGAAGSSLVTGGVLGLLAGAVLTALTYYGLLALPTRHVFTVTTALIAFLAAGMAAQAAQYFYAAGVIDVLGHTVWDTSHLLSQDSFVGHLLHILIGYADRPSQLQLLVYVATLAVMAALIVLANPSRGARRVSA